MASAFFVATAASPRMAVGLERPPAGVAMPPMQEGLQPRPLLSAATAPRHAWRSASSGLLRASPCLHVGGAAAPTPSLRGHHSVTAHGGRPRAAAYGRRPASMQEGLQPRPLFSPPRPQRHRAWRSASSGLLRASPCLPCRRGRSPAPFLSVATTASLCMAVGLERPPAGVAIPPMQEGPQPRPLLSVATTASPYMAVGLERPPKGVAMPPCRRGRSPDRLASGVIIASPRMTAGFSRSPAP